MDLRKIFIELSQAYCKDEAIINSFWLEIEKKYSSRKRYYHTLTHLKAIIDQLSDCRDLVKDWDALLFSIFYHDIIYNVLRNDNEERSAGLAAKRLSLINFPANKIDLCKEQILATKSHDPGSNTDTDLFTDADLFILGQSRHVYDQYCLQIRKEYSIYPDMIYKTGRKKVLDHFLNMERIFKTSVFYEKYEQQARANLNAERDSLS